MNNSTLTRTILNGGPYPYSVFVTADGNVFVSTYGPINVTSMWAANATTGALLMNRSLPCYSVFVDINSTLYCSVDANHTVLAMSLNAGINSVAVVAGTGGYGPASTQLKYPYGIYIDTNFNLYVADSVNSRIQFLKPNQLAGTTGAGSGASGTIALSYPSGVTADGNRYLFIVDNGNHRVVGSGPNGFHCIAACSGQSGSSPSQLNSPRSLAFDTDGNLFIADTFNSRIQKFFLASNFCGECCIRFSTIRCPSSE